MLDQSFSYENLKEIYDIEKRKGHSLDEMFPCAGKIAGINSQIKDIYKEIKTRKLKFSKKPTEKQKVALNEEIDKLEDSLTEAKESKKIVLKKEFEGISNEINSTTFSIDILKTENFLDSKKSPN